MTFDGTKALEVIKDVLREGGLIKAALASACGLFLLFGRWGWVPPLDDWVVQTATFGLLLFGFLALASFISAVYRFFPIDKWVVHWITIHRERVGLREFIPYMAQDEREIIAYLLAKKQKTFCTDADGGRAKTLLSRGIVITVAQDRQHLDMQNVPMAIPDHLWSVLESHRDHFPYTPADDEDYEEPPWREASGRIA
jgi:hypothetical protein